MAQLLVRNVDDDLVRRLKMRAVTAGRSAEAEHRLILEQALRPDVEAFKERARRLRERTKGGARSTARRSSASSVTAVIPTLTKTTEVLIVDASVAISGS